jgi:hypothetical protein
MDPRGRLLSIPPKGRKPGFGPSIIPPNPPKPQEAEVLMSRFCYGCLFITFIMALIALIFSSIYMANRNTVSASFSSFIENKLNSSYSLSSSSQLCKLYKSDENGSYFSTDCSQNFVLEGEPKETPFHHGVIKTGYNKSTIGSVIIKDKSNEKNAGLILKKYESYNDTVYSLQTVFDTSCIHNVNHENEHSSHRHFPFTVQFSTVFNQSFIGINKTFPQFGFDVNTESRFSLPVFIKSKLSLHDDLEMKGNFKIFKVDKTDRKIPAISISKEMSSFNHEVEFNQSTFFRDEVIFSKPVKFENNVEIPELIEFKKIFDSLKTNTSQDKFELDNKFRSLNSTLIITNKLLSNYYLNQLKTEKNITDLYSKLEQAIDNVNKKVDPIVYQSTTSENKYDMNKQEILNLLDNQDKIEKTLNHIQKTKLEAHKFEIFNNSIEKKIREYDLLLNYLQNSVPLLQEEVLKNSQLILNISKTINELPKDLIDVKIRSEPSTTQKATTSQPIVIDDSSKETVTRDIDKCHHYMQSPITVSLVQYHATNPSSKKDNHILSLIIHEETTVMNVKEVSATAVSKPTFNGKEITVDFKLKTDILSDGHFWFVIKLNDLKNLGLIDQDFSDTVQIEKLFLQVAKKMSLRDKDNFYYNIIDTRELNYSILDYSEDKTVAFSFKLFQRKNQEDDLTLTVTFFLSK